MPLWQKDILVNFWWGCCIYSDCGSTSWCILVPSQEGRVRPHEYFWKFHSNFCKLCLAWEHLDGHSMGLREIKKQRIKKNQTCQFSQVEVRSLGLWSCQASSHFSEIMIWSLWVVRNGLANLSRLGRRTLTCCS